ncbi:MAG: tetratricopeptide repeat protein, partial [Rhodothermales bacterium]
RYRLVEEIGRGGMGSVYRAERDDGLFEQQVAVKLMRPGLEELAFQKRFEQERQILARLRHEGIAHLLDGGVTDESQPYLVMEYIEGTSVTEYADRYSLSPERRIGLFRDVCAAVHYAHQNLVIHRDLKPGNILVTDVGSVPGEAAHVKLLDFGIARLIEEDEADADDDAFPLTRTGMRVMTFEYAAPEQVRGEPVTTATDVYALGILLYELLTGQRPYDVRGLSPSEVERVICTTNPERPSAAASRSAEARRPPTPPRRLRGDLDNIVLKALRKEPERRYASVAEFSEDLRRYLEGLPVEARSDSVGYRVAKFVGRHRWGVAAAVLLLMSLVGGLAATAWQAQEAMRERDRAQAEAAKAERINQFLQDMLTSADPYGEGDRDVTVLEVLQHASIQLDTALADQPDVRAAALTSLGTTYLNLGRLADAERHLREALELRQATLGPEHADVGETTSQLAIALQDQGAYAEADLLFRRVIAINMANFGEIHKEYATALSNLATLLFAEGDEERLAEAESLQRRALAIDEELFGETHETVAIDVGNLATLLSVRGETEEAEALYRRALAINRQVLGDNHPTTLTDLNNLAATLAQSGDLAEAESMLREVLTLRHASLGEAHPHVANTLLLLGQLRQMQDDPTEAATFYQDALTIYEQLFPEDHPQRRFAQDMLSKTQAAE